MDGEHAGERRYLREKKVKNDAWFLFMLMHTCPFEHPGEFFTDALAADNLEWGGE